MAVNPVPAGYHTVNPALIVRDVAAALDFYATAFGAKERLRLSDPEGNIVHAEFDVGDAVIFLGPESAEWGNLSPQTLDGSAAIMHVYVDDVDAVVERAVAAGAKLLIPVSDQFYGDRAGRIADPFGHLWALATHIEDMTPEEMQRRFEQWLHSMSAGS